MVYGDRVQETTTTTGTGTFTLGGAVTGFQSFSNVFANGTVVTYTVAGGSEWEVGEGTYSAGTLTRTTIFSSSNSNSLVTFSAGTKAVFCDIPATQLNSLFNLYNATNGLRLTLTTGVPVPTADVVTATTIYLTPYTSGSIGLYYNGNWRLINTAQISLAVGTVVNNTNYDIFAYYNGSSVALEFSTAWTSNTVRATALVRQDGVLVKTGDPTRRYIGTVRTVSTTQLADTASQRFVYNEYNQIQRHLQFIPTANWTLPAASATTIRQGNGSTTWRFDIVNGNPVTLDAKILVTWINTAGSGIVYYPLIGINQITTNNGHTVAPSSMGGTGFFTAASCSYMGILSIGYNAVNWLEKASTTSFSFTPLGGTGDPNDSILYGTVRM